MRYGDGVTADGGGRADTREAWSSPTYAPSAQARRSRGFKSGGLNTKRERCERWVAHRSARKRG